MMEGRKKEGREGGEGAEVNMGKERGDLGREQAGREEKREGK